MLLKGDQLAPGGGGPENELWKITLELQVWARLGQVGLEAIPRSVDSKQHWPLECSSFSNCPPSQK